LGKQRRVQLLIVPSVATAGNARGRGLNISKSEEKRLDRTTNDVLKMILQRFHKKFSKNLFEKICENLWCRNFIK
jgi:hypothetical protein